MFQQQKIQSKCQIVHTKKKKNRILVVGKTVSRMQKVNHLYVDCVTIFSDISFLPIYVKGLSVSFSSLKI